MHQKRIRRINFDARPLATNFPSGVGYYTNGLISALAKEYPDITFIGHYYNFLGKNPRPRFLVNTPNISYSESKIIPEKVANQLRRLGIFIPFELLVKNRGDINLFPAYLSSPSLFNTPSVVAIHDLSYLNNGSMVSARNRSDLRRFVPGSIARSSLVLAISKATKKEIVKHYGIDGRKILVHSIPPPPPLPVEPNSKSILLDLGISGDYVMFLGTIEPRKNIVGLIAAFELLDKTMRVNCALVLAGGKGWNDHSIREAIKDAKKKGTRIIETGYVTEYQKAILYKNAKCLVLASHEEGFGMPILEAATYGTPSLLSDIPVFHEVAGVGALYFDQTKPQDIAILLNRFLTNARLRQKLTKNAEDNLERYSWTLIARSIMSRIDEIGKE